MPPLANFLRACAAACACALQLAPAAPAHAADDTALPAARPRIALVLSGGGARGFAHIGVLRVLRELRVPVDVVVGTSMGSVVGGAYAAGASVADLERIARETDWEQVVADRPPRDVLTFRRREEDVLLPSRIEFGVHRDGVSLPPSAAGNAALEQALGRLLPAGTRDLPVSQLALPFRSVASDLLTGEPVELVDTPLFLTMRASLAVPGVFAPVRIDRRLVVDGGLVRNLPVNTAHAMGADIVIAVNVGTPLAPEKELGSALGVAQQMLNILTEQNVQRSLKEMQPQDILLAPDLDGMTFLDFKDAEKAIGAGERAARALTARLAPLAMAAKEYALFENRRLAPPALADAALTLAKVEASSTGHINPQALAVQSGLKVGQQATLAQVRHSGRHAVRPRRPGACRDRHHRLRRQAQCADPRHRGAMGQQPAARRPRAGQRFRRRQQLRAQADAGAFLDQQLGRGSARRAGHRRRARRRRAVLAAARRRLEMVCGAGAAIRLLVARPVCRRPAHPAPRLQRAQRQLHARARTGQLGRPAGRGDAPERRYPRGDSGGGRQLPPSGSTTLPSSCATGSTRSTRSASPAAACCSTPRSSARRPAATTANRWPARR